MFRITVSFIFAMRVPAPCARTSAVRPDVAPATRSTVAPGALLMFKPTAKPLSAEGVGKYAIKFSWNDNHDLGIYSWGFLREVCPCEECKTARAAALDSAISQREPHDGSDFPGPSG